MSRALNLSNSIYSQWNTKKTKPSKRTLPLIAEYLDTTVEYLIGQEDDLSGDEPDQDLYESILSLCQEKGIKGGKMCVDIGFSKSLMTDLKSGRKKGITSETAQKIADYFSVSVDRVLNGPSTKKAPTPESERTIDDDDIKFALFGDAEIDDSLMQSVREFAAFAKANWDKKEKEKKKGM